MEKRLHKFILILLTFSFAVGLFACSGGKSAQYEESSNIPVTTAPNVESENDNPNGAPTYSEIPTMHIELNDSYKLDEVTKSQYVDGTCTLIGGTANGDIIAEEISLKGRGNYSWTLEKKPYTIKFSEKQEILGMGEARRWVLIANYSDKTLMRNYLTLNLAREMGMYFTPECRYVNLVVNGEYRGLYLLTEKIQIHKERVNIDIAQGGVLMEIDPPDRHENKCNNCLNLSSGLHVLIHEPEAADYSEEYIKSVKSSALKLFTDFEASIDNGIDAYSQYIDVDSFVDWYILNEFVKNFDSNLRTSCYCYIGHDGKLYMGPCWDYDTCMGNQDIATCLDPTGFYISGYSSKSWFTLLTRDEGFDANLKARWRELDGMGVFRDMIDSIDETVEYISEAQKRDTERWPNALKDTYLRKGKSKFTFNAEVNHMKNYINIRYKWLNGRWNNK